MAKATMRADKHICEALDSYLTYIEGKVTIIEGLIVKKDPQSMSRLEDIKKEIQKATDDKNGALYSMADDLKQAQIRGKALERVAT